MQITVKVDYGSHKRSLTGRWVKRGEVLGLSPHFDDQVVLSPIDGTIERIEYDSEEQAVRITIRPRNAQWELAHAQ
ncbi:MAG: hypothetical protein HYY12_06965 [Candidatus Methylomirabilis oxyfera]|nr:hypothetical protein [Candidatus Methylomirabilis oxyfera]